MHCPFCGADDTKVIDSRLVADGDQVRRRRECQTCSERFTTFETAELVMPRIVKRDGIREPFNEDKLRSGLLRALEKRPVSTEEIEAGIARIMHRLRSSGERELPSRFVGEEVMRELRQMDGVAYVRFASVYRAARPNHRSSLTAWYLARTAGQGIVLIICALLHIPLIFVRRALVHNTPSWGEIIPTEPRGCRSAFLTPLSLLGNSRETLAQKSQFVIRLH